MARVFLTTTDQTRLFDEQQGIPVAPVPPHSVPTIRVDPSVQYQEVTGFGAAITDASAWVLHSASGPLSDALLELLFLAPSNIPCFDADSGCQATIAGGLLSCATDFCPTCPKAGFCNKTCGYCKSAKDGLGLSTIRITMGVSDFSMSYALGNITYADVENDWDLEHFSTNHDDDYILPVLRRARQLNPKLKIIASPWTAPLWLKDPPGSAPDYIGGGTFLDTDQAYETYSDYFVRFAQEYQRKGVPVDYVTLQNEPGHGGCGSMPCMLLPEPAEAKLAVLVGQKLAKAGLQNTTRILGYDHNWGNGGNPSQPGPEYPTALLNDSAASPFIAGVAWHCYGGEVSAEGPVHDLFPTKEVHLTECSGGTWSGPWDTNFLSNVQNLFVGNVNNWGQSTLLWNVALDEQSGPHCQGGSCCTTCRGVITVPSNASTLSDITRNVEFYSLAHFSTFVPSGSRRIESVAPGGHAPSCQAYCSSTGCDWTKQYSCPWQPPGTNGHAGNDGSLGYECCCVDRTKVQEPCGGNSTGGTPLEFAAFVTPGPDSQVVLSVVNPSSDNQTMSVQIGSLGFSSTVPPGAATLVMPWTTEP